MVLTKSELEIMDVLWAAETALSRSDLLERSQEKNWKVDWLESCNEENAKRRENKKSTSEEEKR